MRQGAAARPDEGCAGIPAAGRLGRARPAVALDTVLGGQLLPLPSACRLGQADAAATPSYASPTRHCRPRRQSATSGNRPRASTPARRAHEVARAAPANAGLALTRCGLDRRCEIRLRDQPVCRARHRAQHLAGRRQWTASAAVRRSSRPRHCAQKPPIPATSSRLSGAAPRSPQSAEGTSFRRRERKMLPSGGPGGGGGAATGPYRTGVRPDHPCQPADDGRPSGRQSGSWPYAVWCPADSRCR